MTSFGRQVFVCGLGVCGQSRLHQVYKLHLTQGRTHFQEVLLSTYCPVYKCPSLHGVPIES